MEVSNILLISLCVCFFLIIVLAVVYVSMTIKNKNTKKENNIQNNKKVSNNSKSTVSQAYNVQSVFDFMDFEDIDDNMIIQKKGKRFLMVIECKGINYDLMSEVEQTSVEEGFIQFLNTIRYPVQIYTQTRTVNLEKSLENYRKRIDEIEERLNEKNKTYKQMLQSGNYSQNELDKAKFEAAKERNLYEYGRDIIFSTERLSSNKNVLKKQYYVIISYYYSETDDEWLDQTEIKDNAFSDLYVKAQSIIRTLAACNVTGKILNSYELVELLYNAYNRDEAETYGMDKAKLAGYDELYTTAPDVLDKKINLLNKEIERQAMQKAQDAVNEVKSEKEKRLNTMERDYNDLIDELAEEILKENEPYFEKDIIDESIAKVRKNKKTKAKKGGDETNEETTTNKH